MALSVSDSEYTSELAEKAEQESRIITPEEADLRKKAGIFFGLVTIILVAAWPAMRTNYGSISSWLFVSIFVWRSGNQNL